MSEPAKTNPSLLKARMRHTRLYMLASVPVILFSQGVLADSGAFHETMEWMGLVLIVACVLGRSYCSAFIGGRKNSELVTSGPFSVVRNPLYVFSFLGVAGIGLQSGQFLVFGILVLTFMAYYFFTVRREEAFLLHRFGDTYKNFMRTTPRWIPDFSKWRESDLIETRPRFIRQTMLDASLFFLPFPVFELVETLHEKGFLPVYWHWV